MEPWEIIVRAQKLVVNVVPFARDAELLLPGAVTPEEEQQAVEMHRGSVEDWDYSNDAFRRVYCRRTACGRFATIFTSLVGMSTVEEVAVQAMLNAAENRGDRNIHIVSLGGGPGFCALAVARALHRLFGHDAESFKFTIVDPIIGWAPYVARHGPRWQFIQGTYQQAVQTNADMQQSPVAAAIQSADVVLISYVLQSFPPQEPADNFFHAFVNTMRTDSLLMVANMGFNSYLPTWVKDHREEHGSNTTEFSVLRVGQPGQLPPPQQQG